MPTRLEDHGVRVKMAAAFVEHPLEKKGMGSNALARSVASVLVWCLGLLAGAVDASAACDSTNVNVVMDVTQAVSVDHAVVQCDSVKSSISINLANQTIPNTTLAPPSVFITFITLIYQSGPGALLFSFGPSPEPPQGAVGPGGGLETVGSGGTGTPLWLTFFVPGHYVFGVDITSNYVNFNPSAFPIFTVDVGTQLPPPTNLQATQLGFDGTKVVLSWNYGNTPVDGFSIQSKIPSNGDGPNSWSSPISVPFTGSCSPSINPGSAFTCTYIDTNVPTFFTTSYQMSAHRGSTTSSASNIATAYQLKECGPLPLRSDCNNFINTGTDIQADFTPDPTLDSIHAAATALPPDVPLKFDHFNWLSYVEHWPQCYLNLSDTIPAPVGKLHMAVTTPLHLPGQGSPVSAVGQVDPPIGGYFEYFFNAVDKNGHPIPPPGYGLSDQLPFYYNEQQQWYLDSQISLGDYNDMIQGLVWPQRELDIGGSTAGGDQSQLGVKSASFYDQPDLPCLPGNPPDYWGFLTYLVGVTTPVGAVPPSFTVLNGFVWNTTYNSMTGGISTASVKPPVIGGSGEIFNVAKIDIANLPPILRQQLIDTGASGVSTAHYVDKSAPLTTAFLSGPQGANGWYTGAVTITLIATDIDGPSDVAATSYSVDGSSVLAYSGPFTISADRIHAIQFGSVDLAGNTEPVKTITIKIDKTPPVVACSPSPNILWPPNNKLVPVNLSVTVNDTLSGPAGFTLVSVTASEPDSGLGDIQGFVSGTASTKGQLRAQRLGSGTGRVYTFTYNGSDEAGNTTSCTSTVTVPHDQGQN